METEPEPTSKPPTIADINNKYDRVQIFSIHQPSTTIKGVEDYIAYLKEMLKLTKNETIDSLEVKIKDIEQRWGQGRAFKSEKEKVKPKLEEQKRVLENKEEIIEFINEYHRNCDELLQLKKKILLAKPEDVIEFNGKAFRKPKKIYYRDYEEVGLGNIVPNQETKEYCGSCSVGSDFVELQDKSIRENLLCDCRGCIGDGMYACGKMKKETTPIKACPKCSFTEVGILQCS